MPSQSGNKLELLARLVEIEALRFSPAGLAVVSGKLEHRSRQVEAGLEREVQCEVPFVLLGDQAGLLAQAPLGSELRLIGFLAARSLRSRQTVLHVTEFEFLAAVP